MEIQASNKELGFPIFKQEDRCRMDFASKNAKAMTTYLHNESASVDLFNKAKIVLGAWNNFWAHDSSSPTISYFFAQKK